MLPTIIYTADTRLDTQKYKPLLFLRELKQFSKKPLHIPAYPHAWTLFKFRYDINYFMISRTNPIGMKGHMAKCYGDLVQELWSGTQKNIAPLKLRVGYLEVESKNFFG